MADPVDIQDVRLPTGRALPVSGMNPHPAAKVPADAYLTIQKVEETSIVAATPLELTLAGGTKWTIMQVEVWRSGVQTNADNVMATRGGEYIGGHYNLIPLTGAEIGNGHSNVVLKLTANFTDTVGIWVTYWYSD